MGSLAIILASKVLNNDLGFGDGKEDFLIKALVPKAAMKTFNESILPGTARLNVKRLDVGEMTPILNDMGDKFRAVVRADIRWSACAIGQVLEYIQHAVTADRAGRMNDQTLARKLIDHRQHLHRPTVSSPIHNKIPRPDVPRIGRLYGIAARSAKTPFSSTHRPHAQAFLPTHALDAFAINAPAFVAQQLMNKPIAPTGMFFRQGTYALLQTLLPIGRALGAMIITRRRQIDHTTCPSRRAPIQPGDMLDGSSLVRRAHHFFELISFNTRLSSIASASIFFNSAFSFSKPFNRLASARSMPPYCFFQR